MYVLSKFGVKITFPADGSPESEIVKVVVYPTERFAGSIVGEIEIVLSAEMSS